MLVPVAEARAMTARRYVGDKGLGLGEDLNSDGQK